MEVVNIIIAIGMGGAALVLLLIGVLICVNIVRVICKKIKGE